jgi:hypothetical protein
MKNSTRLLAIVIFAVVIDVFVFWKFSLGYLIWMASDLAWLALAMLLFRGVRPPGSAKSGGGGAPVKTDRSPSMNPDRRGELVGAR